MMALLLLIVICIVFPPVGVVVLGAAALYGLGALLGSVARLATQYDAGLPSMPRRATIRFPSLKGTKLWGYTLVACTELTRLVVIFFGCAVIAAAIAFIYVQLRS